uniref:protein BASIC PENTACYSTEINE2-like n=1 Tax=Erigeron canadensis TaxID=72917 RepID=UPI001CB93821|nr:protein BASIC PENTACYSTEINE2-like [Erigeron canadensis]
MDDDGLRNWGCYYEPADRCPVPLPLLSSMVDHRDTKPLFSPRENPMMLDPNLHPSGFSYHLSTRNSMVSEARGPLQYMGGDWIHRERLINMLPGNHNLSVNHGTSSSQSMHMMQQQFDPSKDHGISLDDLTGDGCDSGGDGGGAPSKKRTGAGSGTPKQPRAKKPKKAALPKENGNPSGQRSKSIKRNMDVVINGIDMDISGIPIPVCSCTGVPQQCYRWGCGGWQSACCTTTISMYPLPMSTKRRGARIAGRKMSQGAFKKVLEKLASESYNFANAIDLRTYWAKHGTNKFVTIR